MTLHARVGDYKESDSAALRRNASQRLGVGVGFVARGFREQSFSEDCLARANIILANDSRAHDALAVSAG